MAEYKYIKQIYGLDDWVIFIFKINWLNLFIYLFINYLLVF
jgi:hypothetical protein